MGLFELVFPIVEKMLLQESWPEDDIDHYFELAYRDADVSLYVSTNDRRVAYVIAQGVVERMRSLRSAESS